MASDNKDDGMPVKSQYDESRTVSDHNVTQAPDGGWGWVVCLAALVCMIILDGMMFSFGVLFLELIDYFDSNKGQTAMVGSALMGTHLLFGPVTSALVNAWGVRSVTMIGAVIASMAFACSVLSNNITTLTIIYGVIGGIGVSMIYLPSILAVGFYFDRRRALANGIAMSGSGIGTFLYSPLSEYLLREYGWKGTMLILSGICLNCLVCGALYRPIEKPRKEKLTLLGENDVANEKEVQSLIPNGNIHIEVECDMDGSVEPSKLIAHLLLTRDKKAATLHIDNDKFSSVSVPNTPPCNGHTTCRTINVIAAHRSHNNLLDPRSCTQAGSDVGGSVNVLYRPRSQTSWNMKPLYKKDVFYSGSVNRIAEYKQYDSAHLYAASMLTVEHKTAASNLNLNSSKCSTCLCPDSFRDMCSMLKQMVGIRLMKNPTFIISIISMVFWTTHSTVLMVLPDYVVLQGVSRERAALLLSLIGGANTIARIGAGWLSDRPEVDCLYVNIAALFIGGITCVTMAFSSTFVMLAVQSSIFGLCMGTWTSLRPIILVELLGLDNLTNAFGLVAMFQGAAFVAGPPLAGGLFDMVQSYKIPFILAGSAFVISGALCLMLCILPCTKTHKTSCGSHSKSRR